METQSSNTVSPGNIRILWGGGLILFLASVSFRGLPVPPCKGSGTGAQSSNAVSPENIRILGGVRLFLPSVSVRGLPFSPCKGVGRGNPKF